MLRVTRVLFLSLLILSVLSPQVRAEEDLPAACRGLQEWLTNSVPVGWVSLVCGFIESGDPLNLEHNEDLELVVQQTIESESIVAQETRQPLASLLSLLADN